jgi:hypothetical protein
MYFEIPDNEKLFIDKSKPDRIVITGLSCKLSMNQVIDNRKIIVKVNELFIDGEITHPGGVVDITARVIHSNHGKIDVTGENGVPNYENRAQSRAGVNPGDAGFNGDNGGDGKPGGTIKICAETLLGKLSLLADGGKGGTAQNGGNGTKGKRGNDMHSTRCIGPTNGLQGGAAGAAGKPGNGGKGGHISIVFINPPETDQLIMSANGGLPGNPGTHGNPGAGGDPGKGGAHYHFDHMPCTAN